MKKTLLLGILALSLVLSGCSLVVKDPVVDMQQTIFDINGNKISKESYLENYNMQLNQEMQMQQFYQMYGMTAPETDYAALQEKTKEDVIRRELISQEAARLNSQELSEEEQAELQLKIDTQYQETLDSLKQNYLPDTDLTGEELDKELTKLAEDTGNTKEYITAFMTREFITEKVKAETVKDVAVSEEEIMADFDAKVEADKAAFAQNPDSYGQKVNSDSVAYFAPEGYRWVKQVLIRFNSDDQVEIDRLSGEKTTADSELQEAIDAQTANTEALAAEGLNEEDKAALAAQTESLSAAVVTAQEKVNELAVQSLAARNKGYENILPTALDVYTKAATESFDDLVKEFNDDAGMPERGYAIREGFSTFDAAFVEPAMKLEKIGDVAEPSQGIYGYYIVQYAGDVTPGAVALADVRDDLHEALLEQAQTASWEGAISKWKEDAAIKEYLDRLED